MDRPRVGGQVARPDMMALRRLVAAEVRRFPELGTAWRRHGPDHTRPR